MGFANMGNTATSCPGVASLPSDIGDFLGPAQSYNIIVPKASSQQAISAEGAYFVFGFGKLGQAAPWIDDAQIFRRDSNSAAQLFVALATGVPVDKFKGIDTKTNSGTVTAVAQSVSPEAAIGFVSGEVADANCDKVRTLAFQAKDQTCGYWPDSTASSFDKKNVRSGKYYIWREPDQIRALRLLLRRRRHRPETMNDKRPLAEDVRAIITAEGAPRVCLVGHDIGLMVAYTYARAYRDEVSALVLAEAWVPGLDPLWTELERTPELWHFGLHQWAGSEALIEGRQAHYFTHFFDDFAYEPKAIPDRVQAYYAELYSRPETLHTSMQWYRTFERDAFVNRYERGALQMPILVMAVRNPWLRPSRPRASRSRPTARPR